MLINFKCDVGEKDGLFIRPVLHEEACSYELEILEYLDGTRNICRIMLSEDDLLLLSADIVQLISSRKETEDAT